MSIGLSPTSSVKFLIALSTAALKVIGLLAPFTLKYSVPASVISGADEDILAQLNSILSNLYKIGLVSDDSETFGSFLSSKLSSDK